MYCLNCADSENDFFFFEKKGRKNKCGIEKNRSEANPKWKVKKKRNKINIDRIEFILCVCEEECKHYQLNWSRKVEANQIESIKRSENWLVKASAAAAAAIAQNKMEILAQSQKICCRIESATARESWKKWLRKCEEKERQCENRSWEWEMVKTKEIRKETSGPRGNVTLIHIYISNG